MYIYYNRHEVPNNKTYTRIVIVRLGRGVILWCSDQDVKVNQVLRWKWAHGGEHFVLGEVAGGWIKQLKMWTASCSFPFFFAVLSFFFLLLLSSSSSSSFLLVSTRTMLTVFARRNFHNWIRIECACTYNVTGKVTENYRRGAATRTRPSDGWWAIGAPSMVRPDPTASNRRRRGVDGRSTRTFTLSSMFDTGLIPASGMSRVATNACILGDRSDQGVLTLLNFAVISNSSYLYPYLALLTFNTRLQGPISDWAHMLHSIFVGQPLILNKTYSFITSFLWQGC